MNIVVLTGRTTKNPEIRYGGQKQTCIANFTLAVDKWDGKQRTADFIGVTTFGKSAELVEKYVGKGMLVGIIGKINTGSYEKDGKKVYVTNVVADRVEFLSKSEKTEEERNAPVKGFTHIDDDMDFGDQIPF